MEAIKFVKSQFGYEVQKNGRCIGNIWKTSGVSKWYLDYPRKYFVYLKDAKEEAIKRAFLK